MNGTKIAENRDLPFLQKQFIPQEVCLACQGCCRFSEDDSIWLPHLLDEELASLSPDFIFHKKIKPIFNFTSKGFICPFLKSQENVCAIYSCRPFECQLYPFLLNQHGQKVFLAVDPNCPYIKEKLNTQELDGYVNYLAAFFAAWQKIIRDNPQIIQAYPNVLDVIEIEYMKDFLLLKVSNDCLISNPDPQ